MVIRDEWGIRQPSLLDTGSEHLHPIRVEE